MPKKKLCNNCRFLDLSFNGYFSATCKKKYFKNIKYSNPMIAHPEIHKSIECNKFKYYDENKKQHYIYVAMDNGGMVYIAFCKFNKDCKSISDEGNEQFNEMVEKLKLKKGEQKRIPIHVDKAEVVK